MLKRIENSRKEFSIMLSILYQPLSRKQFYRYSLHHLTTMVSRSRRDTVQLWAQIQMTVLFLSEWLAGLCRFQTNPRILRYRTSCSSIRPASFPRRFIVIQRMRIWIRAIQEKNRTFRSPIRLSFLILSAESRKEYIPMQGISVFMFA